MGIISSKKMAVNAICVLSGSGDNAGVNGTIHIREEGKKITLTGEINGLAPGISYFTY